MFAGRELAQLQLRKADLLAESDSLREQLIDDWARIRPTVSWVDGGVSLVRRSKPILLAAAPLLGFWLARNGKPRRGWRRTLRVGWRVWRTVAAVWRTSQFIRPQSKNPDFY